MNEFVAELKRAGRLRERMDKRKREAVLLSNNTNMLNSYLTELSGTESGT